MSIYAALQHKLACRNQGFCPWPLEKPPVVTGSTSGIGLAIAHALAAEGHTIVVNSFTDTAADHAVADAIAKQHKVKTAYIKADMSKPS